MGGFVLSIVRSDARFGTCVINARGYRAADVIHGFEAGNAPGRLWVLALENVLDTIHLHLNCCPTTKNKGTHSGQCRLVNS